MKKGFLPRGFVHLAADLVRNLPVGTGRKEQRNSVKLYNQTGQPSLSEGLMLESMPREQEQVGLLLDKNNYLRARRQQAAGGMAMLCLCPSTVTSLISDLD